MKGTQVDRLGVKLDVEISTEEHLEEEYEGNIPEGDYYEGRSAPEEYKIEYLSVSDYFRLMTRFTVAAGEGGMKGPHCSKCTPIALFCGVLLGFVLIVGAVSDICPPEFRFSPLAYALYL